MRAALRKYWPVLKAVLALAILVAVGRGFYRDLRDHPDLRHHPLEPGWLLLSGALYLLGLAFSALCWYRLMRSLDQRPPLLTALRAYYIGHMGKYLPGKAWALFLRAGLVRGPGVRVGLAGITAFYEVLVTMSCGAFLAAVFFALLLPDTDAPLDGHRLASLLRLEAPEGLALDRALAVPLAVALFLPLLVPILPPVFNRLVHHLSLPFRARDEPAPRIAAATLGEGLLIVCAGWACYGASLWAVLQGVLPQPPPWSLLDWGRLTAIMGVGYVAGFVILFVPSGLGVREFFLTLFLLALLACPRESDEGRAVVLAVVVLRLVWTAAELVMIAAVWRLPGPPVLLRKDVAP
jgi:uncharacterized membrane protein YbhN (UPF0104 family)